MFDPYYKWLGIRPEHQPPDHYRLLGLERFESDRDVIQSAGERQTAHVQSYKIGPQSDLSQKILNEIARAKVCLLNPTSKAEYDAQLRAAVTSQVAPPPPVQAANRTASTFAGPVRPGPGPGNSGGESDEFVVSDASIRTNTFRSPRKPAKKPQTLPQIVIAVCLLLIIGAVASTFLIDFSDRSPAPEATATPRHAAPKVDPSGTDGQPRRTPAANLSRSPESAALPSSQRPQNSPVPQTDTRLPIPSGDQIADARSKFTIQGKLTPAVTLDAAKQATHPWTRYTLLQMTIELAYQADHATWPEARRCAIDAARTLVAEFQLPRDFSTAVASQFQKRPSETESTLRDRVSPNDEQTSHPGSPQGTNRHSMKGKSAEPAQANPDVLSIDAPLIDLTKNQFEVKFKPLVNIEPRKLVLTGLSVSNNQLVRQYPDSGEVELGAPLRVVLRDEPPRAGLEVSLHGTDELYVRIKPMIQDPEDVFYPWTESGIRIVRGKANRSLKDLNRAMERASELISDLSDQSKVIRNSSASRTAISEKLEAAQQEVAQLGDKLQKLEQFLSDLDNLTKLTDEVDRKARLGFRVVQKKDGEEVRVVQTNH